MDGGREGGIGSHFMMTQNHCFIDAFTDIR